MDLFGKKSKAEKVKLEQLVQQAGGSELLNISETLQLKQQELAQINQTIINGQQNANNLSAHISSLQSQVVSFNDQLELESFSIYTPRYAFRHSMEFKTSLDQIREQQKIMIRNKTATISPTGWSVNNSKAEGKKMINGLSKLLLRSFNNECEACVLAVKFSNIDICERRIRKSFETINSLAQSVHISITVQYLQLKLNELFLAYEYAVKKQEEKDEEKALRDQLREEKRLEREIEEARRSIAKEQKHYQNSLNNIQQRLSEDISDVERQELLIKESETLSQLNEIDKNLEDIDYRESNKRAGYVYVVSNLGAFGENVYKIGMTRRLEPFERVNELSGASVPFIFDVHAMIFSDDAPALETALHNAFANRKLNQINQRKEFFRVTLEEIEQVIRNNHDKTVEIVKEHDAEQYRETLKLSGRPT